MYVLCGSYFISHFSVLLRHQSISQPTNQSLNQSVIFEHVNFMFNALKRKSQRTVHVKVLITRCMKFLSQYLVISFILLTLLED